MSLKLVLIIIPTALVWARVFWLLVQMEEERHQNSSDLKFLHRRADRKNL